jgi:solute carrier family 25 carnitine/acylcarnitine transporter 20/29
LSVLVSSSCRRPVSLPSLLAMDHHGLNPEHISTFKDLTSGTFGGMCGLLIGQPLDRVKVLSQTASVVRPPSLPSSPIHPFTPPPPRPGTVATLLHLTRREGFLSLWKGVGGPILFAAPLNALAFAGNGKSLRYLDAAFPSPVDSVRPYSHYLVSGCVGGFTQTIAAVPAELIKCRLQIQVVGQEGSKSAAAPKNALQMIRHIYATEGLLGFMRGFSVTCWRDIPSYGVYFGVYEIVKDVLLALPSQSTSAFFPATSMRPSSAAALGEVAAVGEHRPAGPLFTSPVLPMLISGAVAGASSWLSCYPIDVIKSVIQTQEGSLGSAKMWPVIRSRYQQGGWRSFFRGLSPTLIRSVPVNAVTFTVYEHSQILWERAWPTYVRDGG